MNIILHINVLPTQALECVGFCSFFSEFVFVEVFKGETAVETFSKFPITSSVDLRSKKDLLPTFL